MRVSSAVACAALGVVAVTLQGCALFGGGHPDCMEIKFSTGGINGTVEGGSADANATVTCPEGYEYSGPALQCGWANKVCVAETREKIKEADCYKEYEWLKEGDELTKWPKNVEPELMLPDNSSWQDKMMKHVAETTSKASAAAWAAKEKAAEAAAVAKDKAAEISEKAKGHASKLAEKAKSAAGDAKEKASAAAEHVKGKAKEAAESAKKAAGGGEEKPAESKTERRLQELPKIVMQGQLKCVKKKATASKSEEGDKKEEAADKKPAAEADKKPAAAADEKPAAEKPEKKFAAMLPVAGENGSWLSSVGLGVGLAAVAGGVAVALARRMRAAPSSDAASDEEDIE